MTQRFRRIGVDTGGTFTDVFGVVDGDLRSWKLPSTPGAGYEQAVLEGAGQVAQGLEAELVHSSTVATNALLERKGARCALVTTRGFRDCLEIGRQARPDLYALHPRVPASLVPRERRFELTERVSSEGQILEPLNEAELSVLPDQLRAVGAESVAVIFLFSFLRPEHEQRVGAFLREQGWEVSLSHDILPEFREVERSSTTVVNAYVAPPMQRYLSLLETGATDGSLSPLRVVRSNGGTLSPERAGRHAVETLLSGPAAGVLGALELSSASDPSAVQRLITFDMGGTSTDVALVDVRPQVTTGLTLGGFPVGVPMVDIHTVGAGGGSLATVDAGGALRVGPESAGAEPGPACYGHGGGATVTDAHVVLGHLHPDRFLQGEMTLDARAARTAMETLGKAMGGVSAEEASHGILKVANLHMEQAIRVISVQRGFDPQDFTLVGFGGAGGLHVFALAEALGIHRVMVPRHPGVLSALGAAASPLRQERSKTLMWIWEADRHAQLLSEVDALCESLRTAFQDDGVDPDALELRLTADMRYAGQSHEVSVDVSRDDLSNLAEFFFATYAQRYGVAEEGMALQLVTLRVEATLQVDPLPLPVLPESEGQRMSGKDWLDRDELKRGDSLEGPCVVVEAFHTVVLPAGWMLEVDRVGNLIGTVPDQPDSDPGVGL